MYYLELTKQSLLCRIPLQSPIQIFATYIEVYVMSTVNDEIKQMITAGIADTSVVAGLSRQYITKPMLFLVMY
jgi:hypothetical protein